MVGVYLRVCECILLLPSIVFIMSPTLLIPVHSSEMECFVHFKSYFDILFGFTMLIIEYLMSHNN